MEPDSQGTLLSQLIHLPTFSRCIQCLLSARQLQHICEQDTQGSSSPYTPVYILGSESSRIMLDFQRGMEFASMKLCSGDSPVI